MAKDPFLLFLCPSIAIMITYACGCTYGHERTLQPTLNTRRGSEHNGIRLAFIPCPATYKPLYQPGMMPTCHDAY